MDNGNNTVIDTYNYSFIIMFITVYINRLIYQPSVLAGISS